MGLFTNPSVTEDRWAWAKVGVFALVLSLASLTSHANLGEYSSPWQREREDRVSLGISANRYINKKHPNQKQLSDLKAGNVVLSGQLRQISQPESLFQGAIDARVGLAVKDESYGYVDVPELYLGLRLRGEAAQFQLSVGRKLESWNRFEEFWALGLYQPRFRWDYLDVKTNGLFGTFLGFDSRYLQGRGFFSPIFIPEQGAPFSLSGGKCTTSSPWFNCPGATVSLFNQPTDVYYKLELPDILPFINRPGYGGFIRLGDKLGPWVQGSYGKKAVNQVLLAYTGFLNLTTQELPATIFARAIDHEIYSAEGGYNGERVGLMGTWIREKPARDVTNASWTTQEENESIYWGPTFYSRLFGSGEGETSLDFGYLRREGGNPPEKGPFANPNSSVFEPRHSYKEAYSFSLRTPILERWGPNFWTTHRFVYETTYKGNILVTDAFFKPAKAWLVQVGFDIMGSSSAKSVDFVSRYQRNDRFRGGVKYVF